MGMSKGNGSSSRGKPYGVMLLIAFGAALLGVMVLHKFRERRICNLLLKQRDQQLLSLHLLFQKQKDHNKELEKNNQDMKSTVYSLRTRKMELDRKLLEMQSTIDSLKDEQKTIEIAFQEKQNEIKMLRLKEIESRKENTQVLVLTESLEQKKSELEDLRQQLESQAKVRSVATDDPSNPRVHSTMSEEQLLESSSQEVAENGSDFSAGNISRRVELGTQKSVEEGKRREMMREQRQKQESLKDGDKEKEVGDGDVRKVDVKESQINKDHKEEEEVRDSQETVNQKSNNGVLKSGKKRETEKGKNGHTSKIKGKRWKYIARKRRLDNGWRLISKTRKLENNLIMDDDDDDGVISMRNRKFFKGEASNEEKMSLEATNSLDSSDTNLPDHQLQKIVEDDMGNLMEKEGEMLMKPKELNSTESDILSEDGEEKQEDEESSAHREVGDGSIEQNPGEGVEPKDLKTEEKPETEQDTESRFNGEISSDAEEGKEEYKEETDDSEF